MLDQIVQAASGLGWAASLLQKKNSFETSPKSNPSSFIGQSVYQTLNEESKLDGG